MHVIVQLQFIQTHAERVILMHNRDSELTYSAGAIK
jgi:hypothetical protein